jgi:hypothetical protein
MSVKVFSMCACLFLAVAFPRAAFPESYFADCGGALAGKSFSGLNGYINTHWKDVRPDLCLKINDSEFLVISGAAPKTEQGLYYINVKTKVEEFDVLPSLKVREEFTINRKRMILLSNVHSRQGINETDYLILYLGKSRDKKPYKIQFLESGVDYAGKLCSEYVKWDVGREIAGYRVMDRDTESMAIYFTVKEQDCRTLELKTRILKYLHRKGEFKSASNP